MKDLNEIDLKVLIEQEIGEKFNRDGYIKCPFHSEKTPSMSVKFFPNANKQRYKCWGCECKGDAIDFIMNYKNMKYNEAREYLGLEFQKSVVEDYEEIIRKFVRNQVANGNKNGYKPLGIYTFVNENNKPIYSKVKFLKPDKKKETPYYHIEDGRVINNRSHEEVPYNYCNLLQGITNGKIVIIVEGEKDVNTLSYILNRNEYVVTSLKGFKAYDKIKTEFMKVYVIGDTGEAGFKYVDNIKYNFLSTCKSFKVINLQGIQALGDNKDVTDWLESGHTRADLLNCFNRSLDLKDKEELQQDKKGIYYFKFKKADDIAIRSYITNFNILEASKVSKVDEDIQGIRIKIKSCIDGRVVEKIGDSKIFNDVKTFRNILGMDYSFTGTNVNDLVRLKDWINKYFALDDKKIYTGTKFLPVEGSDKFELITAAGALKSDSNDQNKVSENTKINIIDVKPIEKEGLKEVMQYIFKFLEFRKAVSIIGSLISFLQVAQSIASKNTLHHLLIVGESESGKSTILKKIIAPLLNMDIKEIETFASSPFSLQGKMNIGNYPLLIDEFKPSMFDSYKVKSLSNIFRVSYERQPISRGSKNFEVKEFYLERPLIMCGEESYSNGEKANMTRSCIVYIGKKDRTLESSKAVYWFTNHEELLNKLGKSLILEILNLPVTEYKTLREELKNKFKLKDRPLNTAINISCGIELLNKVLIKNDIEPIKDYYESVQQNMFEEVLDGREDARSTVEQMLCLYNDMLQDNKSYCNIDAIKYGGFQTGDNGKIYIRTQLIIDSIFKYIKDYDSVDIKPIKSKDFKKQAKKSGYIIKCSSKQKRVGAYQNYPGNNAWFDEYDRDMLVKLNLDSIVECDG